MQGIPELDAFSNLTEAYDTEAGVFASSLLVLNADLLPPPRTPDEERMQMEALQQARDSVEIAEEEIDIATDELLVSPKPKKKGYLDSELKQLRRSIRQESKPSVAYRQYKSQQVQLGNRELRTKQAYTRHYYRVKRRMIDAGLIAGEPPQRRLRYTEPEELLLRRAAKSGLSSKDAYQEWQDNREALDISNDRTFEGFKRKLSRLKRRLKKEGEL